jgi:hypothetical protein
MTRLCQTALRLVLALTATLLLTTAASAIPQTFVSATGSNANTCARTAPCRTFAGALAKTDAKGEIVVLDAGEYGVVTINKAVRITAVGVYAGIDAPVGVSAVTVTVAVPDVVALRGLTLTGKGASYGIHYTAGGTLHVESCTISGFISRGISFVAPGQLFVKDTVVRNNNTTGIYVAPGTSKAIVSIDHCRVEKHSYGVYVTAASGVVANVVVRDSLAAGMSSSGFYANGAGVQINVVDSEAVHNNTGFAVWNSAKMTVHHCISSNNIYGFYTISGAVLNVKDCTAANNFYSGIYAEGTSTKVIIEGCQLVNSPDSGLYVAGGATALISDTIVTGNGVGLNNDPANHGTLETFGNNRVRKNTTDRQGTITTVPQI